MRIPSQSTTAKFEHLTHPKYRADIDGLRSIAVIAVVFFHAFPGSKLLKGGFIGVDIFFVISGYLISTIIISNLERGNFSFIEFYSRRIRRIFPALLTVLIASFVFGWFALLADEYKQLGKHIAGGAGFISNFLFWQESGYFDNAAETKPLLHLWSLGIEEQFYILWPLLLWIAFKKRVSRFAMVMVVASISFFLNINEVKNDSVAAFYSPQTRFWELLVGSILAYLTLHKKNIFPKFEQKLHNCLGGSLMQRMKLVGNFSHDAQSILGALLILTGIMVVSKEKLFPGWWALLPTLGAVLIISAGTQAWFNRVLLSSRVLVWFGLISFPLYLWHWPLLSFARILEGATPSSKIRVMAVLMSIGLAWLTYKLIEKPMRFGRHHKLRTLTLLALMVAVGLLGYVCYTQDGLVYRQAAQRHVENEGDIGHDVFHQYPYHKFYLCSPNNIQKEAPVWGAYIRCFQSQKSDVKQIAIIGDSHTEHLFIGLAEALPETNVVYYVQSSLPYINNPLFKHIFESVINDANISTVILTADWSMRINQYPKGSTLKAELDQTMRALTSTKKNVYLGEGTPTFSFDAQRCKYSKRFYKENICSEDRKFFYDKHAQYYPILQTIVENNPGTKILKMSSYFCDANVCEMAKNGLLLYRDSGHLNINGSKYIGRKIVDENPELAN